MIRVLLVEDDPMVAELNRTYVDMVEGFVVVAAARNGEEARLALREKDIDLILLDIFMPSPSGLDLLSELRASGREVDALLVTAARDMKTINRALKLGAVDYLIKPFEFDRLRRSLEQYRATRLLASENRELSQNELDSFLGRAPGEMPNPERLPKGLDHSTLPRIWKACRSPLGEALSCEKIAEEVGLSRVSVKKYLEYLVSQNLLHCVIVYGKVGRPVHLYSRQASPSNEKLKSLGLG